MYIVTILFEIYLPYFIIMRLPYQKLIVREKSMTLAKEVYILTKKLPKEEMWRFCSQLRRASVSVPSNIAE